MLENFFIRLSEVPFIRARVPMAATAKKEYYAARQIVEAFAFKYHRHYYLCVCVCALNIFAGGWLVSEQRNPASPFSTA